MNDKLINYSLTRSNIDILESDWKNSKERCLNLNNCHIGKMQMSNELSSIYSQEISLKLHINIEKLKNVLYFRAINAIEWMN